MSFDYDDAEEIAAAVRVMHPAGPPQPPDSGQRDVTQSTPIMVVVPVGTPIKAVETVVDEPPITKSMDNLPVLVDRLRTGTPNELALAADALCSLAINKAAIGRRDGVFAVLVQLLKNGSGSRRRRY